MGRMILKITPTLIWNGSNGATSYSLEVSTDSLFSSYLYFYQSGLTNTYQYVGKLRGCTKFFWHVRATGSYGTSSWSARWSFTTILQSPVLSLPTNGSKNVLTSPTIIWNPSICAIYYTLQVSTDSLFSSYVYDQGLTDTSKQMDGLRYNTKYLLACQRNK